MTLLGMKIPVPSLLDPDSTSHYFYSFFGTVDRKWRRNEWMFVKVGIASDVHRRLTSYKTHCPVPFNFGIRALFPDKKASRLMESAMLADDELNGYRSQGEWFVIMAGPEQHVIFIKTLLARFYIERFRDKSLWPVQLEWILVPDEERVGEIEGANRRILCGVEDGTGNHLEDATNIHEEELALRVRAESQAEAIGRLIYPELNQ